MTKGKTHKVVRFLISPKKKKVKIEVNKIMNPAFLLGTAFNIAYWHRKYHSGTGDRQAKTQKLLIRVLGIYSISCNTGIIIKKMNERLVNGIVT